MMQSTKYLKGSMSTCQRILSNPIHKDKLTSLFRVDMSKEEIMKCPSKLYDGKIHVISSEYDEYIPENQLAIEKLLKSNVVGFDTESKVIFDKACIQPPTALIQLYTEDVVVLWRLRKCNRYLRKPPFPGVVKNILQNPDIKKIGTGTSGDQKSLHEQYEVMISNLYDTQKIAQVLGFHKLGLASLTAQLFGWKISKQKRLSNWEANTLDSRQISYAATDAWASFVVFKKLESLMQSVGMNPSPLPSTITTVLRAEVKKDRSLFNQIDSKLLNTSTDMKRASSATATSRQNKRRRHHDNKPIDNAVFHLDDHEFPNFIHSQIEKDSSSIETDTTSSKRPKTNHFRDWQTPFYFQGSSRTPP